VLLRIDPVTWKVTQVDVDTTTLSAGPLSARNYILTRWGFDQAIGIIWILPGSGGNQGGSGDAPALQFSDYSAYAIKITTT
jgi:hypothetical protein